MSRRKQRAGYGRDGLFEFVPGGIADVPDDNPLTRPCPKPHGCGVPAGQRCRRQVPRRGWVDLSRYHDARTSNEVAKVADPASNEVAKQEVPQVNPTSNEGEKVKPRHLNLVPIDRGDPS